MQCTCSPTYSSMLNVLTYLNDSLPCLQYSTNNLYVPTGVLPVKHLNTPKIAFTTTFNKNAGNNRKLFLNINSYHNDEPHAKQPTLSVMHCHYPDSGLNI